MAPRKSLPDDAVGALAQLFGNRISLIDDEVLVKDLEDLASLQVGHDGRRMPLARGVGSRGGKGLSSRDDDNGDDDDGR